MTSSSGSTDSTFACSALRIRSILTADSAALTVRIYYAFTAIGLIVASALHLSKQG